MRVLVFNWHEAYLALLCGIGHEWLVADWHRPWNHRFRPLPGNARLCSRERDPGALLAEEGVDLVLAQVYPDLAWLGDTPAPLVFLTHNALHNDVRAGRPEDGPRIREAVHAALAPRRGLFVAISEMKRESWAIEGDVIPPGIDVDQHGGYTGEIPAALTVANLLKERAHMLGDAELRAGLEGRPWRVLGTDPAGEAVEAESFQALQAAYRSHRLYAHATLWPWEDGYNLALLEAMATGMPPVVWANPTSPITSGVNGFVADDAAAFQHWAARLIDDPALAQRLGRMARRTVAEAFGFEPFRERWQALLERAVSVGRSRPRAVAAPLAPAPSRDAAPAAPAFLHRSGPPPERPQRIVLATAWTPISTSAYYARAFAADHDVITWGPHMDESTLARWREDTDRHALKPDGSAEEKIRLLRGLTRPADVPAPEGQPDVSTLLDRLPRGWRPDLFVWIDGGPGFLPQGLERLDCETACLVGDTHTRLDWRLEYARRFAHVFVMFNRQHVAPFRDGGCPRVTWLPAACDPDVHRPFDVAKAFDVVFVGQTSRAWHPDRVRLLEQLMAAGIDVHVTTKILEEMALAFARGRIVFNRSLAGDLNMRVFEALATGSLLFTDRLAPEAGLEDLFVDRTHLVCYAEATLEPLVRHYLAHPTERQAIAEAGREAVLASHTYRHRVASVLADVAGRGSHDPVAAVAARNGHAAAAISVAKRAPAVSIVIPVYDGAAFTRRCLAALARTIDSDVAEVIVVDNGSSDGTADVLRTAPLPVRIIANPENRGFACASNQGARAARGPALVFLNNDTEPEAGWLDALREALAPEDVGAVGARLLYPATRRLQHAGLALNPDGIPDHLWRNAPADDPRALRPRDLDMVTGACVAIRRDRFETAGGFDEEYRNGVEDVDLCLALRSAGLRVVYEPRAVVLHHEGASAGRFDHVDANLRRLFAKREGILATLSRLPWDEFGESPGPTIAWEGSFFVCHSLAGINRAVCRELLTQGIDLALTPYESDVIDPATVPGEAHLAPLIDRPTRQAPVLRVRHRYPPDFTRRPGERLVVMQPWEYGAVPVEWVAAIRDRVDELWVPSEFVRRSFIAGGVPPERVVTLPNGFDPALFHPGAEPLPLPTARRFRFLYVGGSIPRKGYDVLLRAYLQEFTAADDVCLVIKDHAYYRHRLDDLDTLRGRPGAPEILYYWDSVSPAQMASFYAASDWLVHPFRGEGFGLPILEAMACGKPVIVTDAGPVREFCPRDAGLFVPATEVALPSAQVGDLETVGIPTLAEPDLPALRRAMREAYADPAAGRARGGRGAAHVHARYTWAAVSRRHADRLRALLVAPLPSGPDATAMARDLLAEGRVGEALGAFAAIIRRDPANLNALVGAAHCALALDEAEASRALLERVVALAPTHEGARAALAILDTTEVTAP